MELRLALAARALALSWAGFWMFFFVAESAAWHTPVRAALPWVGVGLLFALLALVPWRWETTGGLLLMVVGLSAGITYGIWSPPQSLSLWQRNRIWSALGRFAGHAMTSPHTASAVALPRQWRRLAPMSR